MSIRQAYIGLRNLPDHQCRCDKCREMCERPCWPTPKEARKLIHRGYADKFQLKKWYDLSDKGGDYYIIVPRIVSDKCVFFDKNKNCQLHNLGLKPIEGKKAICCQYRECESAYQNLHDWLAETWSGNYGKKTVEIWGKIKND